MDGSGRQLRRARAGMTLVELLISLTLLVAVAALALPNMFAIMGRSAVEEGRRQMLSALAGARAEAIGAGEPVRVMAEPGERGWRIRAVVVGADEEAFGGEAEPAETLAALPRQWSVLAEIGAAAPAGGAEDGADGAPVAEEAVALVTFLPDGGALTPGEGARLRVGTREFSLRVDRWSGRATLAPAEELEEGAPEEMEAGAAGDGGSGEGRGQDPFDAGTAPGGLP